MVFGIQPFLQWCKLLHSRLVNEDPRRKLLLKRLALGVLFVVVSLSVFYTRAGAPTRVYAATSSNLNFQARLMSGSGSIVADGTYSVQFNLYASPTGGTTQWTETQNVQVKAGYLSVQLGSVTPFTGTINWSEEQWLTMNVNGDGEMDPRLKLTAVPYAFRAGQADTLTITGGTVTGDALAQLAPAGLQSVNSTVAGLRINQVGSGGLLQLASGGTDRFTISNGGDGTFAGDLTVSGGGLDIGSATQSGVLTLRDGSGGLSQLAASPGGLQLTSGGNVSIGAVDATGTLFVLDTKNTANDPTGTDGAMYYNSVAGKFRCYQNGQWQDCINGANNNATASFVSARNNVTANTAGQIVEMLVFTSATGVSNTVGVTGYTAPAAGSFRTCLVKNEANITNGTLGLRWRVNGVSVGAAACAMNNGANNRQSASSLDPGVVTFNAGDTIGIAYDTDATFAPSGTQAFTAYWTVEYNASNAASNSTTLQSAYSASSTPELTLDATRGGLTIRDNATPIAGNLFEVQDNGGATTYFNVTASGTTSANTLTISSGGINNSSGGIVNAGSITGVGANITGSGALAIASGGAGDLSFDSASNTIVIAASDTSLERVAAGAFTINLSDGTDTTLTLNNSGAGNANLNLADGGLQLAGTTVLTSGGVLQNVTASTGILTSGLLSTARGGTGVDGSAAANGQLLIGNGSGFSIGSLANNGGLTITPGSGTLGIAVAYGSAANTAVQGNTGLTCPSGTGNLTGGGTVITLGTGGTCGSIGTINNPTFTTSVTSPLFTGSGAVTVSSGGTSDLTLDSASGKLVLAANDTSLERVASGAFTVNLSDTANTTLTLNNSGTGAANLNLADGALQVNGTSVLSNSAVLSNLTGISSSGTVALSSLNSGGLVKAAATTGALSTAVAGTDYELPLTFGNGLTRTSNAISLGGNLTSATSIGLNGNALTINGSSGSVFSAFDAGGIEIRADVAAALSVRNEAGTLSFFTVNTTGNLVQVGSSTTDGTAILSVLDAYNTFADPTSVDGASYYNTARNEMRCSEDDRGFTACLGTPKPNTRRTTSFIANGGTTFNINGDVFTGTGGTGVAATATEPVRLQHTTTTTINNVYSISGNTNYNSSALPGMQTYVAIPTITTTRVWAGLTNQTGAVMGASSNPAGIYASFRYDTSAGDTTWRCITKNGGAQTNNNSAITVTAGTGYKLEITISSTNVVFKINGSIVCTDTGANRPGANTLMRINNSVTTLVAGAARTIQTGWIYVESER